MSKNDDVQEIAEKIEFCRQAKNDARRMAIRRRDGPSRRVFLCFARFWDKMEQWGRQVLREELDDGWE